MQTSELAEYSVFISIIIIIIIINENKMRIKILKYIPKNETDRSWCGTWFQWGVLSCPFRPLKSQTSPASPRKSSLSITHRIPYRIITHSNRQIYVREPTASIAQTTKSFSNDASDSTATVTWPASGRAGWGRVADSSRRHRVYMGPTDCLASNPTTAKTELKHYQKKHKY